MGKKVDLNARRDNNNIRKSTHNFNHYNNYDDENPETQESNNSPNAIQKKGAELALRHFGVPKDTARAIAQNERTYELAEKANILLKMPVSLKITLTALIIAVPMLMIMIFVIIFGSNDGSGGVVGLGGFPYYSDACTNVKLNSDIISIEDYVATVLSSKEDNFTTETLKVLAIAVRTELIQNSEKVGDEPEECYYEVLDSSLEYDESNITELIKETVNETRGLIITTGDNPNVYYDDSCVYTANQANELESSSNYTNDNYYIKYGEETIGGINFQTIPKTNIDVGSLIDDAQQAENGNPCQDNNGLGLSLNGSLYLEKYEGKTWKEIIEFYYQEESEIMSIYKGFGYAGEFPIDPNHELYTNDIEFLTDTSLNEFLNEQGISVDEYNQYIKSSIEDAGVGTREGVVTAAVTLIGSLAEQGIRLNYQWGGKYNNIGVDGNWGNQLSSGILNYYCGPESYGKIYSDSSKCFNNYKWSSFDCSGFTTWSMINGMDDTSITQTQIFNSERTPLSSTSAVCQPGGMLKSEGHIVLVVGHDDENNRYIVAESTGSNISTGTGGVKLSYYEYGRSGYECINLNEIYGD